MKTKKLSSEQLETMSYTDVANLILTENGKMMNIQELFKNVISLMELPESYFESKIADFFGLLSTDKRFVMLEKGNWDLRDNHTSKVIIADEPTGNLDSANAIEVMNILKSIFLAERRTPQIRFSCALFCNGRRNAPYVKHALPDRKLFGIRIPQKHFLARP